MGTDVKNINYGDNQTWDYAQGLPIREQVTIYLMEDMFAAHPVAQPIMFYFTFYVGKSMKTAEKRHGKTHRLIGIFAHEDGPDPIDVVMGGSSRWGNRSNIRESFRAALRLAILDKLKIHEDVIQYLDKIISDVTNYELYTRTNPETPD